MINLRMGDSRWQNNRIQINQRLLHVPIFYYFHKYIFTTLFNSWFLLFQRKKITNLNSVVLYIKKVKYNNSIIFFITTYAHNLIFSLIFKVFYFITEIQSINFHTNSLCVSLKSANFFNNNFFFKFCVIDFLISILTNII